jgi:catechol 2,3-dioxygenase-like lactoylglutathione lyase family enzyme
MRGTDEPHHIHVTELGEPKYVGIAFHAEGMDDLEKLSRVDGASPIESIDEPGGGKRVRLTDPDGFQVEVVYGMERRPKIAVKRPPVNFGEDKTQRRNALYYKGVERGPSHVKRIGHFVVHSPQFEKTLGWYREMFGLRCSDEVYADSKDNIVGSFNRLDRGDDFVDHHAFFCIRSDKAGLNHLSYEAADIDDIMIGHEHLLGKGYEHFWGIGRHSLGSQVYDYWGDPWDRVHEHWADTDVLNASIPPNLVGRHELAGPWGGPPPEKFMHHAVR